MDRVEATGRTVNEAVENALVRLDATRDQVDIEVVQEGSRGILGIGAEDARVIVTIRAVVTALVATDVDQSRCCRTGRRDPCPTKSAALEVFALHEIVARAICAGVR